MIKRWGVHRKDFVAFCMDSLFDKKNIQESEIILFSGLPKWELKKGQILYKLIKYSILTFLWKYTVIYM